MINLSERLQVHADRLRQTHLRSLFERDRQRFEKFSRSATGIFVDWSKEKIDPEAWAALISLAQEASLAERFQDQLSGKAINSTEQRAVLHTALRGSTWAPTEALDAIDAEKQRFLDFAERVRDGSVAASGEVPFTDVVNIGIGGSDLGPVMAVRALAPFCDGPDVHFISNVDGSHAMDVLGALDPEKTLVLIASKTFTTLETLTNATTTKAWLQHKLGDNFGSHLAALSTNLSATADFGISEDKVFGFWDFVGGRYSIWSCIGLPLAIAIGRQGFEKFLAGAQAMDVHCAEEPAQTNLPMILAMIGVWRRNALGLSAHAVIPYEERLSRFPAYLQQLDMESNGKTITIDGGSLPHKTGMLVFGEPGTNAQHSFFQLMHQGSEAIATDFLLGSEVVGELIAGRSEEHHRHLMANALAQSRALAFGRTLEETQAQMAAQGIDEATIARLAAHKTFPGDRPSTTILYRQLDPATLGKLIALYEHKVYFESVLWGINAYDQWGVELGKELAREITPALSDPTLSDDLDGSTAGLIAALNDLRNN